ncbi:hypothetical protein KAR91_01030 [Candidatus Pacearchaeota archaeon]|nr:hypothetical protein [Candidatus Pacearchaeota archaeon]
MPSPSMIMGILLAVAIAWGSAATWYATELIEQKATVEASLKTANKNTQDQININTELKTQVAAEQRALQVLGQERTNDEIKYQRDLAKINSQRSRAEAIAIENPIRYGVAASYDLRRSMRDVCRRGGGTKDDCKIEPVRPPTPRASDTIEPITVPSLSVERPRPKPTSLMPPG